MNTKPTRKAKYAKTLFTLKEAYEQFSDRWIGDPELERRTIRDCYVIGWDAEIDHIVPTTHTTAGFEDHYVVTWKTPYISKVTGNEYMTHTFHKDMLVLHVPWGQMRINKSFMNRLRETFPVGQVFTNKEAYEIYARFHSRLTPSEQGATFNWRQDVAEDSFLQMTVRNNLCAAAYRGAHHLTRVGDGRYCFAR
jgi:hypothetical protein